MVDKRNSTTGKRRSIPSHDVEDPHASKGGSSSDAALPTANIASSNGGSGGGGGLDTFLQRLDDIDLHNHINRSSAMKDRKHSDIIEGRGSSSSIIPINSKSKSCSPSKTSKTPSEKSTHTTTTKTITSKRIAIFLATSLVLILIYDTLHSPPEKRLLGTHRIQAFLLWVKEHPGTGAAAFIVVYGMCVALLLPGTPLTLGGGYVYKVAYGWFGGILMATFTSMAGSLFGSCSCFIMGRYIMRDRVRRWGRKYPLFDAIDLAVSDNGFKIMCLLYLTPILPLGPVSYMCGTTSMPLMKFAAAKIAALPLMLVYVFIGASTDTFMGGSATATTDEGGASNAKTDNKIGVDDDTHRKMVLFGLCLSIVSMTMVSHFVKKELYKIFDKQKKEKGEGNNSANDKDDRGEHVELIMRTDNDNLLRRQRGYTAGSAEVGMQDEENC